jgi:hypothetical protein
LLVLFSSGYGQTCLNPDPEIEGHLPKNKTAYYVYQGITGNPKNQIDSAFDIWQSTNTTPSQNCSNVTFTNGQRPSSGFAQITVKYEALGGNRASRYTSNYNLTTKEITTATISFDPNYQINDLGEVTNYYNSNWIGYGSVYRKMALHEIGHLMGLSHYATGHPNPCTDQSKLSSVMNDGCGRNDRTDNIPEAPTSCDNNRVNGIYCPTPPLTPTPEPTNTPPDMFCLECWQTDPLCPCYTSYEQARFGKSCPSNDFRIVKASFDVGCVCPVSPILIDVLGNGYAMTNARNGVAFDFNGDGKLRGKLSWTAAGSDDAWLVLDRNLNGTIDNGFELFGNATPQPEPPEGEDRQGFLALAEFDKFIKGGNGDNAIDDQDAVFSYLRLWQDLNHNGISEPDELHTLPELEIAKLELDYKESKRRDEFGNEFRYRAKVWNNHGVQSGRWAWDVFLVNKY